MLKYIFYASLAIIPFVLDFSFFPLTAETIIDPRVVKEFFALAFALGLSLAWINKGIKLENKNIWISLLLFYMIIHPFVCTQILFQDNDLNRQLANNTISYLWKYKPLTYAIVYFIFYLVISNIKFSIRDFKIITKTVAIIGIVTAVYVLIQYLRMDQFQGLNSYEDSLNTTNGALSATLTHPNYSASLLALCLPFIILNRYYFFAIFVFSILYLIQSQIAIFALLGGAGIYILIKSNKVLRFIIGGGILTSLIFTVIYCYKHGLSLDDNGRFEVWKMMFDDLKEHNLWLTGHGFGSYKIYFPAIHNSRMLEAHNELWQFTYEGGIYAIIFLLLSIYWLIKNVSPIIINSSLAMCFFISFLIYAGCSLGQFVTQIEPHRYYGVMLFSLLTNLTKGEAR